MRIEIKPKIIKMTAETLADALQVAYDFEEGEFPIQEAEKLLPVYLDIMTVLIKDEEYKNDCVRVLMEDWFSEAPFVYSDNEALHRKCEEGSITAAYIKNHLGELKKETREYITMSEKNDLTHDYLLPVELHIEIDCTIMGE